LFVGLLSYDIVGRLYTAWRRKVSLVILLTTY